MSINWQEILTSAFVQGILLSAIAWLLKTLISHRMELELNKDIEKFKIEIRLFADIELEKIRAFQMRAAHVHERLLDPLTTLYRYLFDAQGYFRAMTSTVRVSASPEDDRRRCAEAIASAIETLAKARLLIPAALAKQCDQFFTPLFQGQMNLNLAQHPAVVDGLQRAEFWEKAQTSASELEKILKQIEKAARDVIHGEPIEIDLTRSDR